MMRALLSLDRLERASLFSAWLTQIARNLAIDWLRKGQRQSRLVPLVPMDDAALEVPDPNIKGAREAMSERDDRVAVREALRRLPPDQREVALLHVVEGLGQREIARRMGLSQATVSRQLSRALAAMRESLDALRRLAPSLRVSSEARTQTLALVGAVVLLSPAAKASLAASAGLAAGSGAATAAGSLSVLSNLKVALATGGHVMAIGKGIPCTLGVAALITGGAYQLSEADGPVTDVRTERVVVVDEASSSMTPPPPPPIPTPPPVDEEANIIIPTPPPPPPPVVPTFPPMASNPEMLQLQSEIEAQVLNEVQPFVAEIMEEVNAEILPMVTQIQQAAARNDFAEVTRLSAALEARADDFDEHADARAEEFEEQMEAWSENFEAQMESFGEQMEDWGEGFEEQMEDFEEQMEDWEEQMEAWAENLEEQAERQAEMREQQMETRAEARSTGHE
jgi:RNA polymerase sigma factor (sigma-70 family)